MKNHLGSYECKLCLTLHANEGSYLAHTQGKKHQTNLARRAAKDTRVRFRCFPFMLLFRCGWFVVVCLSCGFGSATSTRESKLEKNLENGQFLILTPLTGLNSFLKRQPSRRYRSLRRRYGRPFAEITSRLDVQGTKLQRYGSQRRTSLDF